MRAKFPACAVLGFLLLTVLVPAQSVHYAIDGKLASFDGEKSRIRELAPDVRAGEIFGTLSDGCILAGLGNLDIDRGYAIRGGYTLALLSPEGDFLNEIASNVYHAWPAPSGETILFIDINHNPHIYRDGAVKSLDFQRKVIQFAWLPDASGFVFTGKPADWSPAKINNPESTDEFLRLADSNLFLYRFGTDGVIQLTRHPREDWNPAVSPDGGRILFQTSRFGYSCFFMVNTDGTDERQITFPVPELKYDGNVPIAYSDELFWNPATDDIIYGTSRPDNTPEIRRMKPDGTGAEKLAVGRNPRITNKGRTISFLAPDKSIRSVEIKSR